jgi:hypothetical protein
MPWTSKPSTYQCPGCGYTFKSDCGTMGTPCPKCDPNGETKGSHFYTPRTATLIEFGERKWVDQA